jgi:hypothetical protein
MGIERSNQSATADGTELLMRVWEEQVIAARHFITDAGKRRRDRALFQVQGVHFMLLSLRDYLAGMRDFKAKHRLEQQYGVVVELLEANWKEAL